MQVPQQDTTACGKCGGPILVCRTSRKSKGEWVTVTLDSEPDEHGGHPSHQWFVTRVGATYHAGKPTSRNQRAGMLAAGQVPHLEHEEQCARLRAKRGAFR